MNIEKEKRAIEYLKTFQPPNDRIIYAIQAARTATRYAYLPTLQVWTMTAYIISRP